MGTINFRSVGNTTEKQTEIDNAVVKTPTMFGIKTPLRIGTDDIFEVTTSLIDQIGDNLRNLLLTNHGERLMLYNYGANLRPLVMDWVSADDFDSGAVERIKSAVGLFMPFISLKNFVSSVDRSQNTGKLAAIEILVTYDVPPLEIKDKSVQITLYVP